MNQETERIGLSGRIGRVILFLVIVLLVASFIAAQLGLRATQPGVIDARIVPQNTADYSPWDAITIRRVDPIVGTLIAQDFIETATAGPAALFSPTPRPFPTLAATLTPSNTPTSTVTASMTSTPTASSTASATPTMTPSVTQTFTPLPTATTTFSPTPSDTPTITLTPSETFTPTLTRTPTPTLTSTTGPSAPVARFVWEQITVNPPLQIAFDNVSSGGSVSLVIWDFGDGGSSSASNPTYAYNFPGTYNVSMTVSGPGGSSTYSEVITVTQVQPTAAPPNAAFFFTPDGSNPQRIFFTNQSTGSITTYSWNFGDGSTSTEVNPLHFYASSGVYTVTLIVSGPGGVDTAVRTITVVVGSSTDVAVSMGISNAIPDQGSTVTYTVNVTNNGPQTASNVVISLTNSQPGIVIYNTHTATPGTSYNNGSATWTIGSMPSGASATLSIVTQISNSAVDGTVLTTTASVNPPLANDPISSNNSASVSLTVGGTANIDIQVTKTVDTPRPNAGEQVIYTLTVTNLSPTLAASGVIIADPLPAGVTHVSNNGGGAYNPVTSFWNIGSLPASQSRTLNITVSVNPAAGGTIVNNTATLNAISQNEINSSNNSATASFRIASADLSLTLSVDNPNPVPGETITFTIRVDNGGPDTATNVFVGPESLGSIPPGGFATSTFQVPISPAAPPGFSQTFSAEITASDQDDPDSTPGNNDTSEDDYDEVTVTVP